MGGDTNANFSHANAKHRCHFATLARASLLKYLIMQIFAKKMQNIALIYKWIKCAECGLTFLACLVTQREFNVEKIVATLFLMDWMIFTVGILFIQIVSFTP